MTDQVFDFFYLVGKGVLLIIVIFAAVFIYTKTKRGLKKKQTDNPSGKP